VTAVTVHLDAASLGRAAALAIAQAASASIERFGSFYIALSGGRTPLGAYAALADGYSERLEWASVHVFFGDERCVPADDPRSNFFSAQASLLSRVPIPPSNVHPVPVRGEPGEAARAYEATIRACLSSARPQGRGLDLVLLGLGADGHTASLFPGDPLLGRDRRWVRAVEAPVGFEVAARVTLTLAALRRAQKVLFIVSGREKRNALSAVLSGRGRYLPAAMVRPRGGVDWLVDRDALGAGFREARPSLRPHPPAP